MEFYANPHRRYNALNGDWILVSPHRTKRPWQGQQETPPQDNRPVYDPECYLCPGNTRAGGHINPQYSKTFAFTNDFAALIPDVSNLAPPEEDLFKSESVKGTSRVICFSPNHNQSLAEMDEKVILAVVEFWVDQTRELSETYRWVQVFENKGAVMGSSNPHPHGQIWASDRLPVEPAKEDWQQRDYFHKNQSVLLLDYVERELQKKERIVCENEHWVVLVPFWAVWPFETLLLPRKQIRRLTDLKTDEKTALAAILKDLLVRYDNLFHISFPYTMGWHGAPFDAANADHWQLHAHFYPPLLRSASVKKFMVGYEMLAEAQRDITAEQAAEQLRNLPNVHYKSMAGFEKMSFDFRQFTTTFEQLYGSDARVLEKQFQRYENLYRTYVRHFGEAEFHVLSTPGRTELSGNHTDHNHGKVLAASIDKDSIAVCGRNANNVIRLYSEGYANPFEVDLHNLEMVENEKESTTALLRGIAARFVELGYNIGGFNACITSDVLPGSGLSSSASIEILIGNILNVLLNNGEIAPEELAKTGQFAENNYFGKPCGLMDQLACAIGGIIAIDFADPAMPQVEKINFDFTETGYRLLVVNTGGSHADLTNDYASIPAEMKAVAQFFGADYLRQVSEKNVLDQMNEVRKHAGDRAVLRALHFLQENQRVEEQVAALQDGNLEKFLELVKHSGDSSFKWLQNIYSPSNDQEQGITLALALAEKFIHEFGEGACRIHGGGFAGTILAFLPLKAVAQFRKSLEPVFGAANIEELTIRQVGTTSIV